MKYEPKKYLLIILGSDLTILQITDKYFLFTF